MDQSSLTPEQKSLIKKFISTLKTDEETAYDFLSQNNWISELAIKNYKNNKKIKAKKLFKVGDIIKCIDINPGKLPNDCYEFLSTYKKFKVLDVNDKLNINVGHRLEESGNFYYFNPNRFELLSGTTSIESINDDLEEYESDAQWWED
jgi:hypothetical protein